MFYAARLKIGAWFPSLSRIRADLTSGPQDKAKSIQTEQRPRSLTECMPLRL